MAAVAANSNNNNNGNRPRPPHRMQTFDSNGPNVKIRGNAYQVFERYIALAREASSSGDRIAAENLYQHAEHYFRIMNANGDGQQHGAAADDPGRYRDERHGRRRRRSTSNGSTSNAAEASQQRSRGQAQRREPAAADDAGAGRRCRNRRLAGDSSLSASGPAAFLRGPYLSLMLAAGLGRALGDPISSTEDAEGCLNEGPPTPFRKGLPWISKNIPSAPRVSSRRRRTLAQRRGHQQITPEHLLKVLIDDKEGPRGQSDSRRRRRPEGGPPRGRCGARQAAAGRRRQRPGLSRRRK